MTSLGMGGGGCHGVPAPSGPFDGFDEFHLQNRVSWPVDSL
eukprot:SAG22_NODE_22362_length_209_cov_4.209091_1_plen_40_part_01